jgi:diphosphomevalonate decarboxylase
VSKPVLEGSVIAEARINIALIKYWGKAPAKRPEDRNLPAVPSLSLTLDGLGTKTTVRFAPELDDDRIVLDGNPLSGREMERCRPVLDHLRAQADVSASFCVESENTVPTAAGLASSASGMAALAAAVARCCGLDLSPEELSAVARLGSGSASRSIFGGWVVWDGPTARSVASREHWDLALVVAVIHRGRKPIASRDAMNLTARTSPFYAPWVESARGTYDNACQAVASRDLPALIEAMELSTMRMHGSSMGANPPILYWKPASLSAIEAVVELRAEGVTCGWTMDAGPNVKVLCRRSDSAQVQAHLAGVDGVRSTLICLPGAGVDVNLAEGPTA